MLLKRLYTGCLLLIVSCNLFSQQPRLVLPTGHLGNVSVGFNKKGDLLLSCSEDKTLIWNVKYGKVLIDLQLLNSKVLTATFNNEGNKIIAVTDKKGVCIIAVNTGKEEECFSLKNTFVTSAMIIQNRQKVITCHTDSSIVVWNLITKKYISRIKLPFVVKQIYNLTGEVLVTVEADVFDPNNPDETRIAKVVNLKTEEIANPTATISTPSPGPVLSSDRFALTYINDVALLRDLKTKKIVQTYDFQEYIFKDIAFSIKENVAAIADDSGVIFLDIKTGIATRKKLNTSKIAKIQFIENQKKILVFHYSNDSCYVYDYIKEKIVLRFFTPHNIPHHLIYSTKQQRIAFTSGNVISIIDTEKWIITHNLISHATSIQSITYSPERHSLLSVHNYKNIKQWNLLKANLDVSILDPTWCAALFGASYCNDNSHIIINACEGMKSIWSAETGKQIGDSINYNENCKTAPIYNEPQYRYIIASINSVDIYDRTSDSLLISISTPITQVEYAALSPNGKFLITIDKNNNVFLWDVDKKEIIKELYENQFKYTYTAEKNFNGVFFNSTGELFVIESVDNYLDLWNSSQLKAVHQFQGNRGVFINDSTIAGVNNSMISFYDINSMQEKFRLIAIGSDRNYMIVLPNGFYCASEAAIKSIHYVKNQNIISFEQLDVKYNRPDKVLEAIGNTDTALIKSYRKAWEKRIKKLGIDTTSFRDGYSVPEADFTNRDAMEYEQKTGTLKLIIKGNDSTYKLDRFNVWVNETPIFGQRGISIRKRNKNDFDTTITLKLSQGENRIETSITNVNGTESYRMPLTVNYSPQVKQKESVRFIGIGIDKFTDSQYNLQYSAKDIRDLSKKLKEKYKDDIIIDTLFNENVTASNVKALKQKLLQTTENDKVILAYSGHGMLSKEFDYYLSTYSVNFEKPEQNGLPYDELENLLDSIPARKKLMLIDACHSGEVDKEDLVTLNASSDSLIKGLKPVAYKKEGNLGLKNSFELMQSLFVNVGKSTGATIISAAAGTQFALERNDLKNGVFTYSILEAMNKFPTMKISELKKTVGERVEQLTRGLQKPTSRNETIAVDWSLW